MRPLQVEQKIFGSYELIEEPSDVQVLLTYKNTLRQGRLMAPKHGVVLLRKLEELGVDRTDRIDT
jgi:hypothetical protein